MPEPQEAWIGGFDFLARLGICADGRLTKGVTAPALGSLGPEVASVACLCNSTLSALRRTDGYCGSSATPSWGHELNPHGRAKEPADSTHAKSSVDFGAKVTISLSVRDGRGNCRSGRQL
ncbi:hypothetical protein VUR80DRAFT_8750 [Thermomyces stellatus]